MEDWTGDLELMHHYTATAHCTFTSSEEVRHALKHDVIQLGLQYGFLLHQVLAFSGFHLSYTQPDQRRSYALRASRHQDRAITGLRTALAGEVTTKNRHALYASSIFLCVCAFATFPSYEAYNKTFNPVDGMVDMLRLMDGISTIRRGLDLEILNGPIRGLFLVGQGLPGLISDRLQQLIDRLTSLESQVESYNFDSDADETDIFKHLLRSMVDSILTVHQNTSSVVSPELRSIFVWPKLFSGRHLDLIKSRRPMALVILTYFCVIIHYATEQCWFVEGWAQAVGYSLEASLAGTVYEEAIRWPISIIRQV